MDGDIIKRFKPTTDILLAALILLVTLLHVITYLLSSYTSSASALKAWWIIIGYQTAIAGILLVSTFVTNLHANDDTMTSAKSVVIAIENLRLLLPVLFTVCCLGLAFHAFSKMALVNFQLPNCIGELRNSWISTPHDQIPLFRRVTSILGHLLSSFTYAGLFFSVFQYLIDVRKTEAMLFCFAFFMVGIGYAYFIGSQNVVLAHVVLIALAVGLSMVSVSPTRRYCGKGFMVFVGFSVLAVFISLSVFNNRVHCNGDASTDASTIETFQQYEEGFLDEIPMKKKEKIGVFGSELRKICVACNSIFIYLNHGIYNFQYIISQEGKRGDPIFFNFFRGVAKRLGYPLHQNAKKERIFGLGGATLPGSAYHDFGLIGVILLGVAHVLLAILSGLMLRSGSAFWEGLGLITYIVVGFVTALSLMFVGFNVIAFPFIGWSALAVTAVLIVWIKVRRDRVLTCVST